MGFISYWMTMSAPRVAARRRSCSTPPSPSEALPPGGHLGFPGQKKCWVWGFVMIYFHRIIWLNYNIGIYHMYIYIYVYMYICIYCIYIYYNYICISMVGLSITNTHKVGYITNHTGYYGFYVDVWLFRRVFNGGITRIYTLM